MLRMVPGTFNFWWGRRLEKYLSWGWVSWWVVGGLPVKKTISLNSAKGKLDGTEIGKMDQSYLPNSSNPKLPTWGFKMADRVWKLLRQYFFRQPINWNNLKKKKTTSTQFVHGCVSLCKVLFKHIFPPSLFLSFSFSFLWENTGSLVAQRWPF